MDIKDMGNRIYEARKNAHYTQRQLADLINVSDKAISKWERGVGCPDISLLVPLSDALHISVNELMGGTDLDNPSEEDKTIDPMKNMIAYAKEKTMENKEHILQTLYIVVSMGLLMAIGICLLIEYTFMEGFFWSIIATSSMIYAWFIISALLCSKKHHLLRAIFVASLGILPFLYSISLVLFDINWFLYLALPISLVSLLYTAFVVYVWYRCSINIWYKLSLTVVLSPVVSIVVNLLIDKISFLPILNIISSVTIAIGFFMYGYTKNKVSS